MKSVIKQILFYSNKNHFHSNCYNLISAANCSNYGHNWTFSYCVIRAMSSVVSSNTAEVIKGEEKSKLKRPEEEISVDACVNKREKLDMDTNSIAGQITDSSHLNSANPDAKDTVNDGHETEFSTFPLAEERVPKKPDSWTKKFKHAVLLSYSGSGYHGLQRIIGENALPSIEEDFLKGLLDAKVIDAEEYKNPSRLLYFQRAARTDKGVSAAKQVLSMKLPKDVDSKIGTINNHLPERVKLMSVVRTTKYFDAKNFCDARTYSYLMPTFALAPFTEDGQITSLDYRASSNLISDFNQILEFFHGTHNYHNFTSQKDAFDASASRYIMKMDACEPFIRGDMEWTVVRVKGQSFMLHQIRKMIGLSIAIIKGLASIETLKRCFSTERIDVPKAPGLGLLLEQVHYDKYNRRYGGDGQHTPITWDDCNDKIIKFKEEIIYEEMVQKEKEENSMFEWLKTLSYHTYDTIVPGPRHRAGARELSVFGKMAFRLDGDQKDNQDEDGDKKDGKSEVDAIAENEKV